MTIASAYSTLCWALLLLSPLTLLSLFFVSAPYGRHTRTGWGPTMSTRWAWVVMESPSVFLFAIVVTAGPLRAQPVVLVLVLLWLSHYVHRALWYPFTIRTSASKPTPVAVAAMGFIFNLMNASANALALGWLGHYATGWLGDPRFLVGVALFVLGYAVNRHADAILRSLRKPGEAGYKIPRGGLYRYISSPNYFGEMLEWGGWALATWSFAGASFAAFTIANLLPRAIAHHRWYKETFPDYPAERRAVIPFLL
ncbi:MAG: DUF1295 domain-containing protein [Myxococcales bacterium]|nr:DUF1295 domain-containing protein [Myxococcales bacterium]